MRDLVLGSRGSDLALWQSEHICTLLRAAHPDLTISIEIIKTLGDKILDAPLSKIGDKGLFTKELERALLDGKIDLAVHSLKDIPTVLPQGCSIGAVTEREDPSDVFIAHPSEPITSIADLPTGSSVATGSLRRRSQLLAQRPDISVIDIRGNLNTRMKKLEESDWSGMLLARAGVKRLGWEERISEVIPFSFMLPAVGQGALGIEIREGDAELLNLLSTVHHFPTASAVRAERAFLRRLEGGCQIPIGTHATVAGSILRLDAFIGSLDGKRTLRSSASGSTDGPEQLGVQLAEQMLDLGGREILDEIRTGEEGHDHPL